MVHNKNNYNKDSKVKAIQLYFGIQMDSNQNIIEKEKKKSYTNL